ncbi:MAG: hypothetical protein MZU97_06655 [Bacillus subtilis]|nr:hypothetical protein [Bacillus subtilis]
MKIKSFVKSRPVLQFLRVTTEEILVATSRLTSSGKSTERPCSATIAMDLDAGIGRMVR